MLRKRTSPEDPYQALAGAVLVLAIRHWKQFGRFNREPPKTSTSGPVRRALVDNGFYTLRGDLEVFFRSRWFEELCDHFPGDYASVIRERL